MIKYNGNSMEYTKHFRCIASDIVLVGGKTLTNDPSVNSILEQGDEVYCIDTKATYLYDQENGTLLRQ